MKKINLQLFDESRAALLRNAIADYAEVDGTYELMGTGFTTLDESPNAQTDSETYINESTASTDITGYETEFSYESRLIPFPEGDLQALEDGPRPMRPALTPS